METPSSKTTQYIKYVLIILVAIIIVLFVMLFLQFNNFRRSNAFHMRQPWLNSMQSRRPLPPADANLIQPWMTFDYLNMAFNLPPEYLKTELSISDVKYPRLPLSRYAQNHNIDINKFLADLKNAILNYSNSKQ